MLSRAILTRCFSIKSNAAPKVCIVGSGPGAFYTAQQMLKSHKTLEIDMFEKLPVPFGLVRYGVAPDHPDVKNVINTFTQVANNERFTFNGNVTVGTDVKLKELQDAYSVTILAYGAALDKKINIPGENMKGVCSAQDFVGWYNGFPGNENLDIDLNCESAAIIGNGNVALDVARILLSPLQFLKKTDIPEPVLERLAVSRIKNVHLIGRRGPLQVAFTIKEFRELVKLPQTCSHISLEAFPEITKDLIQSLPRPRRRLTDLILSTAEASTGVRETNPRHWHLHFLRSPVEIHGEERVTSLELAVNQLEGPPSEHQNSVATPVHESLNCGLVLRSIGYRSLKIDESMPYDERAGVIPNDRGRALVSSTDPTPVSGLYCVGWIKRGPVGVILSTMSDAVETSQSILEDIALPSSPLATAMKRKPSDARIKITNLLSQRGVQTVSFDNWQEINSMEVAKGEVLGKPREKLVSVQDMLLAAFSNVRKK